MGCRYFDLRTALKTATAAAISGALLTACGGQSSHGLSRSEANRLSGHIQALRDAVSTGDQAGAHSQIVDLTGDISALRRAGRLSVSQASMLTSDLAAVRATLAEQ